MRVEVLTTHRSSRELAKPLTTEEIAKESTEKDLAGINRFSTVRKNGHLRIGLNPKKDPHA